MSPARSYRQRRTFKLRVIAAVVVVCLTAPFLYVALQALKGFGAGITVVLAVAASVSYLVYAGRQSRDRHG